MTHYRFVALALVFLGGGLTLTPSALGAALIYNETWEDGTNSVDRSLADFGWQGVNAAGTQLTTLTVNPSRIIGSTELEGQRRTFQGFGNNASQWLTTNEVNFDTSLYEDDLNVSFMHRDTNLDAGEGYRLAFQIGGDWYLQSNVIAGSSTTTTDSLAIDSLNFGIWGGAPPNDMTSFTVPATGGGAPLPGGLVTGFGLLLVKNASDETFRFDDIQIMATPIPEPTTFALAGMGLLLVGVRRWRRRR